MSDEAVPADEVVHVLRLAQAGWPDGHDWTTDGMASACWNGFIAEDMGLTESGQRFLDKVGLLYPPPPGLYERTDRP